MSFFHYRTVKDKICLYHNGYSPEYLIQLAKLRSSFEEALPGIQIYYSCKSEYLLWLEEDPFKISIEHHLQHPKEFAYEINVAYDGLKRSHPIWDFVKESNIPVRKQPIVGSQSHFAYICPEGNFPTNSLSVPQIMELRQAVMQRGFKPLVVGTAASETLLPIDRRPNTEQKKQMARTAGCVVGVECDMLFEAANRGIPTSLVSTGLGTELYNVMYESMKVTK
jgi:hypothetical protein